MNDKTVMSGQGMSTGMSHCNYFHLGLDIFIQTPLICVYSCRVPPHQGLLISSPRGWTTPLATWTQLLSNFILPAMLLLVTGPLGALISDFPSLSFLEISEIAVIQVFLNFKWGHLWILCFACLDLSWLAARDFYAKILGFASGSPWGRILNTGMSG